MPCPVPNHARVPRRNDPALSAAEADRQPKAWRTTWSLYLTSRSLDPSGTGGARWVTRWEPAVTMFAITPSNAASRPMNTTRPDQINRLPIDPASPVFHEGLRISMVVDLGAKEAECNECHEQGPDAGPAAAGDHPRATARIGHQCSPDRPVLSRTSGSADGNITVAVLDHWTVRFGCHDRL